MQRCLCHGSLGKLGWNWVLYFSSMMMMMVIRDDDDDDSCDWIG